MRSLPNGEQHIGQEQVPIFAVLIHNSLNQTFDCLMEPLDESIGLRVVDIGPEVFHLQHRCAISFEMKRVH